MSINLATYFAMHNYPVALADWDVQQSAMMWVARRRGRRPSVMGIDATARDAPWEDLNQLLASERSQVVIDTSAALHGAALGQVLERCDRLVLPITPSPLDMEVAVDFIAEVLLHPAYLDRQMPICAVGNRCRDQDDRSDFSDFEAFLSEVDIPLIALFGESKSYQRTLFDGQSIHETASLTRNEREAEAWSALVQWSLGEPVQPIAALQPERLGKIQAPATALRVGGPPRPRGPGAARPVAGKPGAPRTTASQRRDPVRPAAAGDTPKAAARTPAPPARPVDVPGPKAAGRPSEKPSEKAAPDSPAPEARAEARAETRAADRRPTTGASSGKTQDPPGSPAEPKPAAPSRPEKAEQPRGAENSEARAPTRPAQKPETGSEPAKSEAPARRGPGRPKGSKNRTAPEREKAEPAVPAKRGPGRPKGSKNKAAADAAGASAAAAKRGPGRPKGSGKTASGRAGSTRPAASGSKSKKQT